MASEARNDVPFQLGWCFGVLGEWGLPTVFGEDLRHSLLWGSVPLHSLCVFLSHLGSGFTGKISVSGVFPLDIWSRWEKLPGEGSWGWSPGGRGKGTAQLLF